uniref:Uncharacterized protein n=1 Tax=Arundo donax TaxID=35708 RepID=A0A0A9G6P9_ARUDO
MLFSINFLAFPWILDVAIASFVLLIF